MLNAVPNEFNPAEPSHRALSRWDNEGGAPESVVPPLTNAEALHLRGGAIALKKLVISLPAQRPDR